MDILVISKDLEERSVIQQLLEQGDHKISFVETLDKAFNLITDSGFRYIIVDESEQDQSVQEFIQKMRSTPNSAGQIYILLLIPKHQIEDLATKMTDRVDDFLSKPINPQELKVRIAIGMRILSMGDTLAHAHEQLENLAMYDSLTGLMNSQAFFEVAQGELERARRTSGGISIIAMEIENFKAINDTHGHTVGDKVIKIAAQTILEKSRPYDCIGRWSNDQFTLALSSVISTDAEKIYRRIATGVKTIKISLSDGANLEVKLNGGIAYAQNINAYADLGSFIQSAVQAMNNSKQNKDEDICIVLI